MKLMEIESEPMQISETEYAAVIEMSSSEFQRFFHDIQTIRDNYKIAVSKDGVKFEVKGDDGSISIKGSSFRASEKADDETYEFYENFTAFNT